MTYSKKEIIPRSMFFGRIAVGKTTVARVLSEVRGVKLIDCDKEIWKYYSGDEEKVKKEITDALISGNKKKYKKEMIKFAKKVNWHKMFSEDANYEVSVLGNFYNLGVIPKEIIDKFKIFKIMCYVDTRAMNIKDRGLDQDWVNKVDAMFEDPIGIPFDVIFNEDILGERPTPELKENAPVAK